MKPSKRSFFVHDRSQLKFMSDTMSKLDPSNPGFKVLQNTYLKKKMKYEWLVPFVVVLCLWVSYWKYLNYINQNEWYKVLDFGMGREWWWVLFINQNRISIYILCTWTIRYQKIIWKLVKILLMFITFYKMNTDNNTLL